MYRTGDRGPVAFRRRARLSRALRSRRSRSAASASSWARSRRGWRSTSPFAMPLSSRGRRPTAGRDSWRMRWPTGRPRQRRSYEGSCRRRCPITWCRRHSCGCLRCRCLPMGSWTGMRCPIRLRIARAWTVSSRRRRRRRSSRSQRPGAVCCSSIGSASTTTSSSSGRPLAAGHPGPLPSAAGVRRGTAPARPVRDAYDCRSGLGNRGATAGSVGADWGIPLHARRR